MKRLIVSFFIIALAHWVISSAFADGIGRDQRNLALSTILELRSTAVATPAMLARYQKLLPGSEPAIDFVNREVQAIWSLFFRNTIVKVGLVDGETPVGFYYNPLVDVAVLAVFERRARRYQLISWRALPGERISRSEVTGRSPAWTLADSPLRKVRQTAVMRLELAGVVSDGAEMLVVLSLPNDGHRYALVTLRVEDLSPISALLLSLAP